jgi:hypothetical protein
LTLSHCPGTYTYSWFVNNLLIGGESANNLSSFGGGPLPQTRDYTARITDINGCYNTSEIARIQNIILNNSISFSSGSTSICPNDSVVISGYIPYPIQNYQWKKAEYDINTQTYNSIFNNVGLNSINNVIYPSGYGRYKYETTITTGGVTCLSESNYIDIIKAPLLSLTNSGIVNITPGILQTLTYNSSTYPIYNSFRWFRNGILISSDPSIIIDIPGKYYLIANGNCGWEKSNEVTFKYDCNSIQLNQSFLGQRNYNSGTTTISPITLGNQSKSILINDNWTVDGNSTTLTFQDVILVMSNCAKISANNASNINFINCKVVGCDDWTGLFVDGSQSAINVNNSYISQSVVGLTSVNNGNLNVNSTSFEDNQIHIGIEGKLPSASANIALNNFGNLNTNTNTCSHSYRDNTWNISNNPMLFIENASGVSINGNSFYTIEDQNGFITEGFQSLNSNSVTITDNTFKGWIDLNINLKSSTSNTISENTISNLINIDLIPYISKQDLPYLPVGMLLTNTSGTIVNRNTIGNSYQAIKFFQDVNTVVPITTISNNKFNSNYFGIVSASNVDPYLHNGSLNSSTKTIYLNVECNNFQYGNFGWIGTGSYLNQGSLNLSCGNIFNNISNWNCCLQTTSFKNMYYRGTNTDPHGASNINLLMDGVLYTNANKSSTTLEPSLANNQNGCQNMLQKRQLQNDSTKNISPDLNLLVYPNPTKDFLQLHLNQEVQSNKIICDIFDMSGREISKSIKNTAINGYFLLNLSELSSGVYILKVQYGTNNSWTKKIIKQ